MKPTGRNGSAHASDAGLFDEPATRTHEVAADLAARLEQSHEMLAELNQVLIANERQSAVTRQKLEQLTEANAQLRRELARLTQKEARSRHYADHDQLTGLPNRRLLLDRLNQAIAQAARSHKQVALLFFDLDEFKRINDGLGHAGGDQLLIQVAQRLKANLRDGDTACRYGGDEFIVMLPEVDGEESTVVVEQKIRAQLLAPYIVGDHPITMTLSIGVAVFPSDGRSSRELIRHADSAMYRAKTTHAELELDPDVDPH